MKKPVLLFAVMIFGGGMVWGQGPPPKGLDPGVPAITAAQSANIAAGTLISGKLDSPLDLSQAKVGDLVVLRTDKDVKFDREVVAKKGSRLIGQVAEVHQRQNGEQDSRLGIVFDRLDNGTTQIPLSGSITSVFRANTDADTGTMGSGLGADSSNDLMAQPVPAGGGTSSGGLLGGTTGAVGSAGTMTTGTVNGIANTTNPTSGSVTNATGENVGNNVSLVGKTDISGLHLVPLTGGEVRGGSTLSIASDALLLEKGTTMVVLIN